MEVTKAELRNYYNHLILSVENKAQRSHFLAEKMIIEDDFLRANSLLIYKALPGEVDLDFVLQQAQKSAKTVVLPKGKHLPAELVCLNPDQELPEKIDLAIIPGLAFDPSGVRLGRGGGWYDRLLANHEIDTVWGVGYAEQYSTTPLPRDLWDMSVDKVLLA
jgi:5-formyltetrahydrofolate cyclo-ligase